MDPVREDIIDLSGKKEAGQKYFSLKSDLDTVLVLGGSLGARTINEAMIQNMQDWVDSGVQVLWQTGKLYNEEMNQRMPGYDDDNIQLLEFIDRMDLAYAVRYLDRVPIPALESVAFFLPKREQVCNFINVILTLPLNTRGGLNNRRAV